MTHPLESRRHSDPALLPERLGRYEVLLPIASGGMATVYLARSVGVGGFERDVALKLTHFHLREDQDFVASLMDEARLAGQIRHPNVVSVMDVGEDPHGVFIVMEYVEGDSLANVQRILRKSATRMPLPVTLRVLDDLLLGLHAAHELRDPEGQPLWLVHRDVTPHNVLLGIDGVSKLTDFGIAKAASRLGNTATGLVKGKIAYMAPEQAQGHTIDRRVDVWAAGVLAWEAFSGTRLYDGPNDAAILLKIVRETPTRLRAVLPEIPPPIDDVVAKALSLNVAGRYPTAEAFAEALGAAGKAAGLARAERREVTQFLLPLLGERLTQRKEKAREVRALRQRMGELAVLEPSHRPSTPSLAGIRVAVPRPASRPPPPPDIGPNDGTLPMGTAALTVETDPLTTTVTEADSPALLEPGEALPTEDILLEPIPAQSEQTQTGTAGISTMARSVLPPRRQGVRLLVGGLVVTLLVLVVSVAVWGDDDESTTPAASSTGTLPRARLEPTATATAEVHEPEALATVGADAAPQPSATSPKPAAARPKAPPIGQRAPGHVSGKSTPPAPLGNPYKKP